MPERLLPMTRLPETLWKTQSIFALPTSLSNAYSNRLNAVGLYGMALNNQVGDNGESGAIGGPSDEESAEHFATTYPTSCARHQLALLDPQSELGDVSDSLIRIFTGGTVGFLEIPCGSGAAAASLITCIAELRHQSILPRVPLTIRLLGGDASTNAYANAEAVMQELAPVVAKEAIFIDAKFQPWNVHDAVLTTKLLNDWINHAQGCERHLVLVASFSGYLHNKIPSVKERIDEILRWAELQDGSYILWTEPDTNKSKKMVEAITTNIATVIRWVSRVLGGSRGTVTAKGKFALPFAPTKTRRFTLSILQQA